MLIHRSCAKIATKSGLNPVQYIITEYDKEYQMDKYLNAFVTKMVKLTGSNGRKYELSAI